MMRAQMHNMHGDLTREVARLKAEQSTRHRMAQDKERADRLTEGTITAETFAGLDLGAVFIRDQFGWRRVLKVNARSVTVPSLIKTGWSDTVRFEKIRQVKA